MSGVFREEKNPPSLGSFVTGPYVGLVEAIDKHFTGSPCIGCDKPKAWVCDWMLMKRAKDAIEELLQLRALDQSEIVRLRRQIEAMEDG